MFKLHWPDRVYQRLHHYAQQGTGKRLLACQAAGWLSFLGIRPCLTGTSSPTWLELAVATLLLGFILAGVGPLLNITQPLLQQAGRLSAHSWILILVVGVLTWRHRAGAQLLAAWQAQHLEMEGTTS